MTPPDVSYARSGEVAIAYQVVGDGPTDIVFVRGITGDLLSTWEQPLLVRHVEGLAAMRSGADARQARHGSFGPRAGGAVDRDGDGRRPGGHGRRRVEERCALDAAASSTGTNALFAATYPERCAGARLLRPNGSGGRGPPTTRGRRHDGGVAASAWPSVRAGWGERAYLESLAREWAPGASSEDESFRDWFVWHMRRSLSPGAALTVVPRRDGTRRRRRPLPPSVCRR